MGRYDDEFYLTVEWVNVPRLLTDTTIVGKSKVLSTGSYAKYEIRVNLVPYTDDGDILLYRALRRIDGQNYRTMEIPQRLVTVPKTFDASYPLTYSEFEHVLFSNLYMAMMSDTEELENDLQFNRDGFFALLRRMGLSIPLDNDAVQYKFAEMCNENAMLDDHCIDIYLMLHIDHAKIESDFNYLPTGMFEQYCNSRNPKSYGMVLGFCEDDYDENSRDFRMNQKGKDQICTIIKLLKTKGAVQ